MNRRLCSRVLIAAGCSLVAWQGVPLVANDQASELQFRPVSLAESAGSGESHHTVPSTAEATTHAPSTPTEGSSNAPTPSAVPKSSVASPGSSGQPMAGPMRRGIYAGRPGAPGFAQLPRRRAIQPNPQLSFQRNAKPFEAYQPETTISPYLNLYRDEDDVRTMPNYFTFVRPQLEQLEINRAQQRELQQLRAQLRKVGTPAAPRYPSGGIPVGGTSARYMDTAQFYSGWQR